MQLRIAKHRVVRALRVAVPIVFFGLVGTLTWNYWIRRNPLEKAPAQHAYGRLALLADPFGNGFCLLQFTGRGYDALVK